MAGRPYLLHSYLLAAADGVVRYEYEGTARSRLERGAG